MRKTTLTYAHVYHAAVALRAAARNRFVGNHPYARLSAVIYHSPVGDDLSWQDQDKIIEFAIHVIRRRTPRRRFFHPIYGRQSDEDMAMRLTACAEAIEGKLEAQWHTM